MVVRARILFVDSLGRASRRGGKATCSREPRAWACSLFSSSALYPGAGGARVSFPAVGGATRQERQLRSIARGSLRRHGRGSCGRCAEDDAGALRRLRAKTGRHGPSHLSGTPRASADELFGRSRSFDEQGRTGRTIACCTSTRFQRIRRAVRASCASSATSTRREERAFGVSGNRSKPLLPASSAKCRLRFQGWPGCFIACGSPPDGAATTTTSCCSSTTPPSAISAINANRRKRRSSLGLEARGCSSQIRSFTRRRPASTCWSRHFICR